MMSHLARMQTWDFATPRKVDLIRAVTFRCFRICSSPSLLRSCLNELRKLLLQNGYPTGVIFYNISDVLNSRQQRRLKNPTTTVAKHKSILVLPYLGVQSKFLTKQLKTCIDTLFGYINLRVIFQSAYCIKYLFPYKDRINRSVRYTLQGKRDSANKGIEINPKW